MVKKYIKKITSAISAAVFLTTIILPANLFAQTKETQYFPIPSSRVGPYSAMGTGYYGAQIDYMNYVNATGGVNGVMLTWQECETEYIMVTPLASTNPANYNNSGFSEADFNKIAQGSYSPWSYQHLYYHGSLSANEGLWYNAMKTTWIPQGLQVTANGLRLGDMQVSRPDDGFPIVPGAL